MGRLDKNIEIIGKLKGSHLNGWDFIPTVQGEQVDIRIQRTNSDVATSIQFVNRVVFSDWLESTANDLEIDLDNGIGADELLKIMNEA